MSNASGPDERAMDPQEAEQALHAHALEGAERVRRNLGGALCSQNLPEFLEADGCLRCPTELCFDEYDFEAHQFAEPEFITISGQQKCILHLRAKYETRAEDHPYLVAYMAACINYRDAATAALCEEYGAALLGLEVQTFYEKVCAIVDA